MTNPREPNFKDYAQLVAERVEEVIAHSVRRRREDSFELGRLGSGSATAGHATIHGLLREKTNDFGRAPYHQHQRESVIRQFSHSSMAIEAQRPAPIRDQVLKSFIRYPTQ